MDKYLCEVSLKNYGYWDDPIGSVLDTDDLVDAIKDMNDAYNLWNFKDAEVYAKKVIKLLKGLDKSLKQEIKDWYKGEKVRIEDEK